MVEGTHMLRSITVDNKMLNWLAIQINKEIKEGRPITRTFLSNAIWWYEKKGIEDE
tara:strand:- start:1498 stop:1665 length:168 start_codon:yes stop_codon:yes gene_type:complete